MRKNLAKSAKSKKRVKKYGEVFTPAWLVSQMLDELEKANPSAFDIDFTFLEPSCGNGNFLVEILKRKLTRCETPDDGLRALSSIYAVELLPDNVAEAKKRMANMLIEKFDDTLLENATAIMDKNIICGDFLKKLDINNNPIWFLCDS